MEIKYTLEILTKDIQDIGKLVENLQNSPKGSKLELDLALSKLRNVYDILTVIREDFSNPVQPAVQPTLQPSIEAPAQTPETAPPEPPVFETPRSEPEPEPLAEVPKPEPVAEVPKPEPEPVAEAPKPEPEPVAEAPKPKPEPEPLPESSEPLPESSEPKPEAVKETPRQTTVGGEPSEVKGQAKPEPSKEKDHTIIAEKFAAESSINENLAGNRESGVDSKLRGQPIDHIGRHIGINDRFLIIRELFDGDSDGFGKLIQDLDNAGSLQSASDRLQSQFSNAPEHEGVDILDKLVKRKYSQS